MKLRKLWKWLATFVIGFVIPPSIPSVVFPEAVMPELVWEQTKGPYGGLADNLLATSDGTLYANIGPRIFRSDDGGKTWTPTGSEFSTNTGITALAASGITIYAATAGNGVFRSEDRGKTWTPANMGLRDLVVVALAVSETAIYAGTESGEVFRSGDEARTWTSLGSVHSAVWALAVSSTTVYAGTHGQGIFRLGYPYEDSKIWTKVDRRLGELRVHSMTASDGMVYAGTCDRGVFRSTDGGENWTPVQSGLPTSSEVWELAISGTTTLYAATHGSGVFRFDEGEGRWISINSGLMSPLVHSLAVFGAKIYAGTHAGIFRSENQGESWTSANIGLIPQIRWIGISGSTLYAISIGEFFRSEDGGNSWTELGTGLIHVDIKSLAVSGTSVYVGTTKGRVFLSNDQGDTWTEVNIQLTDADVSALAASDTTVYAGTRGGGIFLSGNGGRTWAAATCLGLTDTNVLSLGLFEGILYAGTHGGVFRSEDNGETWTIASLGGTDTIVNSIVFSGTTLYVVTRGGKVFRSNDKKLDQRDLFLLQGILWTPVNMPLENIRISCLAASGNIVFVGTGGNGVFQSDDQGDTWTVVNKELTSLHIFTLAISGTTMYAGTLGGVFRAKIESAPITYALLAGVSNYDFHNGLVNPVRDVDVIAKELIEAYGCKVTMLHNPTLDEFLKSLYNLANISYGVNDQLLVFFSGHGWFDNRIKRGYLALKDSKPQKDDEFYRTYISHEDVRVILERLPCRHVLLIIDSCFSGTIDPIVALRSTERSINNLYASVPDIEFIRRKLAYKTRYFITSGGKEYVPDGRPGEHSPFARRFIEALRSYGGKDGILTLEEILFEIEKATPQPRAGEMFGHEPGGSFILIARPLTDFTPPSPAGAKP